MQRSPGLLAAITPSYSKRLLPARLLNKSATHCLNKRINSKPLNLRPKSVNYSSTLKAAADESIVMTLAQLTLTILLTRNNKAAQLSRQKISAYRGLI
jgi:phospholipase/lecithinase/hemolysin